MKPPLSLEVLMLRAHALTNHTIGDIATHCGLSLPTEPKRAKGFAGTLLEHALGADSGNKAQADFASLGVELKTLPLKRNKHPQESTYVCTVPLMPCAAAVWQTSVVLEKLRCVLFMPLEADKTLPYAHRRFLPPILWRPDAATLTQLQHDFDEAMAIILSGAIDTLDARAGTYLQVRPKAMHGRALSRFVTAEGEISYTLPRGFYLRPTLTRSILAHQKERLIID